MRLRQKYSAILLDETPENMKLLSRVRNFVAYGSVESETLKALMVARGERLDGKPTSVKTVPIHAEDLEKMGMKPFFRLHPPRGGIDGKLHFGVRKGVLGDNKEKINVLVRKML
jgi:large subunit ribosomal protein L30